MQEIITYILVFAASAYTIYGLIKMFISINKNDNSNICSAGCKSCSLNTEKLI